MTRIRGSLKNFGNVNSVFGTGFIKSIKSIMMCHLLSHRGVHLAMFHEIHFGPNQDLACRATGVSIYFVHPKMLDIVERFDIGDIIHHQDMACTPVLRDKAHDSITGIWYTSGSPPEGTTMFGIVNGGGAFVEYNSTFTYTNSGILTKVPPYQSAIVQFYIYNSSLTSIELTSPWIIDFYIQTSSTTLYTIPELNAPYNIRYSIPPGVYTRSKAVHSFLLGSTVTVISFPIQTLSVVNSPYITTSSGVSISAIIRTPPTYTYETTEYILNMTLS
jgi:hypothetical protein